MGSSIDKISFLALESSPSAVLITDVNGEIVYLNQNAANFFKAPTSSLLGQDFHQLVHGSASSHNKLSCMVLESLNSLKTMHRQSDIFSDYKGQNVWVDYSIFPIKDKDSLVGFMVRFDEASIAYQSQHHYIESRDRFKTAFEAAVDPVIIMDDKAKIIVANVAASHAFDQANLENKSLFNLFPAKFRPQLRNFWALTQRDRLFNAVITYQSRRGSEIFYEAGGRANILPGENLIILHNITDHIVESRRRDQLAAVISHEIKNPLAVVKAYTQLLQRKIKPLKNQSINTYLEKIDDKVDFMAELITNMTDAIRLGSGSLSFKDEMVEFDPFLKSLVDDLQSTYTSHRLCLSGTSGGVIVVDKHRLGQVISNLISNAVKYSPDSHIVNIGLSHHQKYIQVKIIDYGIGIKPEDRSKIFQPFTRSRTTSSRFPGMGLGLYLAKSIISRYNGQLFLQSKPSKGSTFTIRLPIYGKP